MKLIEFKRPRGPLVSRLALLLLALVLVELVLVGQQVESVKGLKKKIYMKKLKKIIPLLALIKPKKKILLVPVSFALIDLSSIAVDIA